MSILSSNLDNAGLANDSSDLDSSDLDELKRQLQDVLQDDKTDSDLGFIPEEPQTLEATGLTCNEVETIVLKLLLNAGPASGRRICEHIKLSFHVMKGVLEDLKSQMQLSYKGAAGMGDYVYELSATGKDRARRAAKRCTYYGAAPVQLEDYLKTVELQSVQKAKLRIPQLCNAFSDMMLSPALMSQIGQAVNAGRGLFLYGPPGNGKTSIAERVINAIDDAIWIPRTITITGEIIRLFDPACHALASDNAERLRGVRHDARWVRIRRPSVMVGGELTLDHLEINFNPNTGINEAPVQMKSNGGALVIDDFGRQRVSVAELLNRWIVPLEKGYDFLTLNSGRQIEVPFDQLLVFATNIDPRDIVDEAFLRRIPYKIRVCDPDAKDFHRLMEESAAKLGFTVERGAIEHLLRTHYTKRPMRFCHVRDLLLQVKNLCQFQDRPLVLSNRALDAAVQNYFAAMGDVSEPAATAELV
jgi:hypothetical protein